MAFSVVESMRAAVCMRYGPPETIVLARVPKPAPRADEILIRIKASTVNSGDRRVRSLDVPAGLRTIARLALGWRGPRQPILGTEFAGVVEAVGPDVQHFRIGDPVFAFAGLVMGCHAEYKCMPARGRVMAKPPGLDFGEAAALAFGGTTVLDFFRRGKLKRGESLLVNGASGTVGSAAVQLARHFELDVTAVCGPENAEWVAALGAHRVIDYTRDDFALRAARYDAILDAAGNAPFARCAPVLKRGGRLLSVAGGLAEMLGAPLVARLSRKSIVAGPASERVEDVRLLAELATKGAYRPVIDCCFPLARIRDAHAYVDAGHKRGSVVVTL